MNLELAADQLKGKVSATSDLRKTMVALRQVFPNYRPGLPWSDVTSGMVGKILGIPGKEAEELLRHAMELRLVAQFENPDHGKDAKGKKLKVQKNHEHYWLFTNQGDEWLIKNYEASVLFLLNNGGLEVKRIAPTPEPKLDEDGNVIPVVKRKSNLPPVVKGGKLAGKSIYPLVKANPRREGTHGYKSFALIKPGMTVEAYLAAGGRTNDLAWDVDHKFVEVR